MQRPLYAAVFLLASFLFSTALAQDVSYYWADGQQLPLTEDPSLVAIHFEEGQMPPEMATMRPAGATVEIHPLRDRAILRYDQAPANPADLIQSYSQLENVRSVSFGWRLEDGFPVFLTHHVVLQLQNGRTIDDLQPYLRQYNATYLRMDYESVILDVNDPKEGLALANALQESGLTRWATPDMYAEITRHADPLYPQQFQMNNTGQTIDGFPGANDADCNAPEAWGITLGSSSITVCVIDDGVEAHEDLQTSGGASRVLGGYTPVNNGNGTPNASGAHGVACTGIIAASHNGLGVQGLAPEVFIRSVNIFQGGESTQDLANAFTWAKNNGADVISNSWGYNSCTFSSTNLTNAIADARNNGRGGLGCVIPFSSGNSYGNCVNYPARLSTVIAVGAFGNDGIKSDYSNAGPTLDIAAPSNDISPQGFLSGAGVRTIDRMGSAGYSSGNYTTGFGGTSAACPVVAGVAALVLSVDANLSASEVENILYTTAIDMGASGRDDSYGWGRVNAFGAVQAAGGSGGGGGGSTCTSTINSFPYTESFESGLGAWTNATGDDIDWSRDSGGTPSSGTGPSSADDGNWYMYVESSSPNYPSKTAIFESPCFDLSGLTNPEFTYSYHMYGSNMGTLRLQASTDGSSWTDLWSLSGDQGNSWNSNAVDLSAYAGESEFRLRFFGTTGNSFRSDMTIDNLSLAEASGGGGGGCADTELTLTILTDNYPGETTWELRDNGGSVVASGGPYGASGTTYTESICVPDGCYDFTIFDSYGDGICCAYGSGSYSLEDDGGNTLASGGAFGSSETTNFCLGGGGGGGSCPALNFNGYTISSYGGQDAGNSFQVQDGGATLFLSNNTWKSINYSYNVTSNTVIEFDFRSTIQGEIHGIGFDNNNSISSNLSFRVYGTQNWGISNYDNYPGGGNWVTYTIPVGSFYTGSFDRMVFIADHDGGSRNGNAYFRNVKVYEGACTSSAALVLNSPVQPVIGDESEWSLRSYPNPVQDVLSVELSGAVSWNLRLLDATGKVHWQGAVSEPTTQIDMSQLAAGVYLLHAESPSGQRLTSKVVRTE